MAQQESSFREIVTFLTDVGVYDVILPFLLVFTIMFAILEKTKVLGVEKIDNVTYTKKNINATVSFVVAFLVIASAQLVATINEVMANIVLLILLGVGFLMLVGLFYKDEELDFADKHKNWLRYLIVLMFIGLVLIFLNALGWLDSLIELMASSTQALGGIIFFIVILGFILFVTIPGNRGKTGDSEP